MARNTLTYSRIFHHSHDPDIYDIYRSRNTEVCHQESKTERNQGRCRNSSDRSLRESEGQTIEQ